jgi:hypothetical protein
MCEFRPNPSVRVGVGEPRPTRKRVRREVPIPPAGRPRSLAHHGTERHAYRRTTTEGASGVLRLLKGVIGRWSIIVASVYPRLCSVHTRTEPSSNPEEP